MTINRAPPPLLEGKDGFDHHLVATLLAFAHAPHPASRNDDDGSGLWNREPWLVLQKVQL